MFINIYYHDLDHPSRVALIECDKNTNFFSSGKIGETLNKAFNKVKDGVESIVSLGPEEFDIPDGACDGGDDLFEELHSLLHQKTEVARRVIERGHGFDMFLQKKSAGWLVVEISSDRSLLVDPSTW